MCALVTGVQTCALPIYRSARRRQCRRGVGAELRPVLCGLLLLRRLAHVLPLGFGRYLFLGRVLLAQRGLALHLRLLDEELVAEQDRHRQENGEDEVLLLHHDLCPAFRTSSLRSEEHTSELQSLMRRSYAVFCL